MLRLRKKVLAAAGLCSISTLATAESPWYVSADFGALSLGSQTLTYAAPGLEQSVDTDFDSGFAAGGTLGYQLAPAWALELNVTYRSNEQEPLTIPALGSFADGNYASLGVGLEGLYQFDIGSVAGLRGYVGGGIVLLQEIDIDFEANSVETSFETDDVAFSARTGVRYALTKNWFLDASVQALFASDVEMELPVDSQQTLTADYDPLRVGISVGYRF